MDQYERPTYHIRVKTSLNAASCILLEIRLAENRKVVFCLPFICKHKEALVKTIRYNLTKSCWIFVFPQNHYIRIWGYFLKSLKKFRLFIEELYTRLYHWYMFEALSLLVSLGLVLV